MRSKPYVPTFPVRLRVVHCPETGIVSAENRALEVTRGEIILLMDDDVVVPPDWVARHLAHYQDPGVGAVGGPYTNIMPDGQPLAQRTAEPVGHVTWYGRLHGNMYDHPPGWRRRPPRRVDQVAGGNMSLRRSAFHRFEPGLKPYWQRFELDACLQVRSRGYRVVFDFANVVEHFPTTNSGHTPVRSGDLLTLKVHHAAYNAAFVLAKHSPWVLRPWRLLYPALVGTVDAPGPLIFPLTLIRYGHPRREAGIVRELWRHRLAGWRAGTQARRRDRRKPDPTESCARRRTPQESLV